MPALYAASAFNVHMLGRPMSPLDPINRYTSACACLCAYVCVDDWYLCVDVPVDGWC